jgi:hypothetical protein
VNSGVDFESNLNADINAGLAVDLDANLDALSTGGASTGAASVRSYNSNADTIQSSIKSIKNNVKNVVASFTNPLDSNSSNRKSSKSSKSSNSANPPKVDISIKQPKLPTKPKGILKKSREPPRNDQIINTQNQYQPDSILAESNLERNRANSRSTWSFASQSNSAYADSQVYEGKWWNHRKVQDNLKFVFTFVFLIVLGMILLITGLALVASGKPFAGHFILIIMGLLFVIPGCYYLFALYASAKGMSGFRFYNLPLFN